MRPLIQPILDRDRRALDKVAPELADLDLSELGEVAHARFEDEPLSFTELAPWLAQRWPDQDPETLIRVVRDTMALVQVPPRGIWGKSGPPRLTTVEAWLGRSVEPRPSIDALVLRYLGAFGPASVGDVQTWSGLTRLGEVVDRLRPRLRIIRDENGRELFDLPDVARTDPDTPAPPRFLPDFDNLLRSHDDRTRVLSDEHRRRIATKNGMAPNGLLVDGFLAGTWKVERPKGSTRAGAGLAISLFHRLCQADLTEVEDEGQRLLAFAAADADADQRIVRVSHLG
jgi:hypothetical protein